MGSIFRFFRDRTERISLAEATANKRAEMWAQIFSDRRQLAARTIRMDKRTLVATGQYYNPTPEQQFELWVGSTRAQAQARRS